VATKSKLTLPITTIGFRILTPGRYKRL